MNYKISDIVEVNDEHIEHEDVWIYLLEYFYHNAYWDRWMTQNTLLH